jgi:hypothetical protein
MKTLLFFARRLPAMLLRTPLAPPAGVDKKFPFFNISSITYVP